MRTQEKPELFPLRFLALEGGRRREGKWGRMRGLSLASAHVRPQDEEKEEEEEVVVD